MYQRFYHLRELPFELTSDPKFLFLPARQREALSNLEYGLSSPKALTLLLGEAGTGKTTLVLAALASQRCRNVRCLYLSNPTLTRTEFVSALATGFELGPAAAQSKAVLLERLGTELRQRRSRGEIVGLVVDEAQSLSDELLEEIRLLGNIETPTERLLPLVLVGQPQLGVRLEAPALRQLKQRIALRCETAAFDLAETAAYIATRIRTADGLPSALFTQEAVTAIHESSGGVARTISVMCDNALVTGMALGRQPVDRAIVLEVCRDFSLPAGPEHGLAAETRRRPLDAADSPLRPIVDASPRVDGAGAQQARSVRPAGRLRFMPFGRGGLRAARGAEVVAE